MAATGISLLLCMVITLGTCLPRPEFVLEDDGGFKYSYDIGNGHYETAERDGLGTVRGTFGYIDENGVPNIIRYTAGEDGYQPEGNRLPDNVEVVVHEEPLLKSAPLIPVAEVPQSEVVVGPVEESVINNQVNADGSYTFSYDTARSSRSETSDAFNTITGVYTFINENGVNEVRYRAGKDIGFVAESNLIPVAPTVPDVPNVLFKSAIPQSPTDELYSFSYSNDDSARSEKANKDLFITGSYRYTPDDGQTRHIEYQAGPGIGFVATGYEQI